jgi:hypothetical protein
MALHVMHYNFCRVHQTLKTTPAIAAGVAGHRWTTEEVVALIPERTITASRSKKRADNSK